MRPTSLLAAALAASLVLAACGGEEEEGPTMKPGSDCLSCHAEFRAAGTVYGAGNASASAGLEGVTVTLTGNNGNSVTLTTNSAGNFYTSASLTSPIDVTLAFGGVTVTRADHNPGACGSCHVSGGDAGIRVHVGPNRSTNSACSACH